MNWFKRKQWKKIGEETIHKFPFFGMPRYYRYAVMECILTNGDRRYKRVLMSRSEHGDFALKSAEEDPLKEINDILKS